MRISPHLVRMQQDWKALAALASDHLGSTMGSVLYGVLIGSSVGVLLAVLFGKLGVFGRPVNKWYHRGVKLYIPYLLVVGMLIGAQCGFHRAVYKELKLVNDAVVGELYQRALGPALGTPAARQAFLTSVQSAAKDGQTMGQAITGLIKQALKERVADDGGITDKAAVVVTNWFIDKYENDIATAVCYGIYLKAGGHLQLHGTGDPMDYHTFKEGADHLLQLDLAKVEAAVQGNLGALTHGIIDSYYKGALKGAILLGALLVLLPVLEWGVYRWVMHRRATITPSPADEVLRSEPPGKGPMEERA